MTYATENSDSIDLLDVKQYTLSGKDNYGDIVHSSIQNDQHTLELNYYDALYELFFSDEQLILNRESGIGVLETEIPLMIKGKCMDDGSPQSIKTSLQVKDGMPAAQKLEPPKAPEILALSVPGGKGLSAKCIEKRLPGCCSGSFLRGAGPKPGWKRLAVGPFNI